MKHDGIKNRTMLLRELVRISETDERRTTRIFALTLAYIIADICPADRSTGYIVKRSHGDPSP